MSLDCRPSLLGSSEHGRVRRFFRRARREHSAMFGLSWFRAGYVAALKDVERTGLRPTTESAIREAADRALGDWVEL